MIFKKIRYLAIQDNFYSITNNMTQKDVDYLLPYHSHIEVSTTLEVLEYLEKQKQKRNMKKL